MECLVVMVPQSSTQTARLHRYIHTWMHFVQFVRFMFEAVPASHEIHFAVPGAGATLPLSQDAQVDCPPTDDFPGEQLRRGGQSISFMRGHFALGRGQARLDLPSAVVLPTPAVSPGLAPRAEYRTRVLLVRSSRAWLTDSGSRWGAVYWCVRSCVIGGRIRSRVTHCTFR